MRDRPVVLIEAKADAEMKRRIDAIEYVAFGHCRYGRSPRPSLERLYPEKPERRIKMTFLVPAEREADFISTARRIDKGPFVGL